MAQNVTQYCHVCKSQTMINNVVCRLWVDQRCRFTLLRSKTTISDNALVKSRTNSFRSMLLCMSMKLKNAISHYALVSSRANISDPPRLKLRTNSCHSRLRRNTAGKWYTMRQHEQKGRIQVDTLDLDWSAQLLCMTFM